jgi:3-isopropylmalate dehydrogenase
MMLRFSLNQPEAADRIESAVQKVLAQGLRTATSGAKARRRWAQRRDGRRRGRRHGRWRAITTKTITKS